MSQNRGRGAQRAGARPLTPEQRRRILEMRRRRRLKRRLMVAIPAAVLVIAAVGVGLTFALRGRGGAGDAGADAQFAPEAVPVAALADEAADSGLDGAGADALEGQGAPEDAAEPEDASASEASDDSEDPGASELAALDDGGEGGADAPEASLAVASASETAGAAQGAGQYVPAGGVFVFDDAYAQAAKGVETGPLIEPDYSKVDASKLDRWPEVTEGYMPITYGAENVQEKVIAITVDDCFQANNLRLIVQCALDHNGKLTIFPIGKNLQEKSVAENVKWAWENGMEIENHTYNHVGMYHYDDERMVKEIWAQSMKLNQVLGVNYQEHFFRPKGGDEREDQRVHAFVHQMGMNAVAIWGSVGSLSEMSKIVNDLKPGQVYLFHTTNRDRDLLLDFIPYASQQGYRLVTLNELYGLPANETSELTEMGEMPALEPFRIQTAYLQKTTYIRAAAVVQKRLIELGWMEGDADGVFGKSSYTATGRFQLAADLKADGKAGEATQTALFADDAPAATDENVAKVKEKLKK